MTELDADADIDIIWRRQDVIVRIPLAGEIPAGWPDRYHALAHRKGIPAGAEEHPGRVWLIVSLPAGTGGEDIAAMLNGAKELIAETDTGEGPVDAAATEAAIRQWWAGQREPATEESS
jgi:hypothetical protein